MLTAIRPDITVAQIVTDHPATARIFQKHRIDFCCHGDVTLPEACSRRGLDAQAIAGELARTLEEGRGDGAGDPARLPTPDLIAHLVERHHAYLREALPFILPIAEKVARVHGERNPRLAPLHRAVEALAGTLLPHLDEEEATLFPALAAPVPDLDRARRELAAMVDEHVAVGRLLEELRELSGGFTTPEWGCKTYRVLMHELEALETDTLRHVHLENHVLAPRFLGRAG